MKPYIILFICTVLILYACQQTPTPTNVVSPTSLHTFAITPTPTPTFLTYTVQPEDTIFSIAERFGLHAETILWANQAQLHDN
ncbi:LysM peptidoglycan-binding domain-containing protein, partial [Thermanaerothrix sp.]|uniref:LysM peptidoglycan-binding domain-containing protein n=1 Tax=Thermanaerothrix sp. TaxID=2972675 RepID=UPI003C7BEB47